MKTLTDLHNTHFRTHSSEHEARGTRRSRRVEKEFMWEQTQPERDAFTPAVFIKRYNDGSVETNNENGNVRNYEHLRGGEYVEWGSSSRQPMQGEIDLEGGGMEHDLIDDTIEEVAAGVLIGSAIAAVASGGASLAAETATVGTAATAAESEGASLLAGGVSRNAARGITESGLRQRGASTVARQAAAFVVEDTGVQSAAPIGQRAAMSAAKQAGVIGTGAVVGTETAVAESSITPQHVVTGYHPAHVVSHTAPPPDGSTPSFSRLTSQNKVQHMQVVSTTSNTAVNAQMSRGQKRPIIRNVNQYKIQTGETRKRVKPESGGSRAGKFPERGTSTVMQFQGGGLRNDQLRSFVKMYRDTQKPQP